MFSYSATSRDRVKQKIAQGCGCKISCGISVIAYEFASLPSTTLCCEKDAVSSEELTVDKHDRQS